MNGEVRRVRTWRNEEHQFKAKGVELRRRIVPNVDELAANYLFVRLRRLCLGRCEPRFLLAGKLAVELFDCGREIGIEAADLDNSGAQGALALAEDVLVRISCNASSASSVVRQTCRP
jgi:hypothetical protein